MNTITDTRRLAAVMFADIEGYTALFQRNEEAALQQVNDHRQQLEEATQKFHGEIIQFYGDGSATIFESVIDAVHCALSIQLASSSSRIPVRIGIHMGDLVIRGGDIFGNVVNIASRIQNVGTPGSILVSRIVADELQNHPEIHLKRLGVYTLKNVQEALELFAVNEKGLVIPSSLPEPAAHKRHFKLYGLLLLLLILGAVFSVQRNWFRAKPLSINEELICIPPFINHTSDATYSDLSEVTASMLALALTEVEEANVVSYGSMIKYFNSDLSHLMNNPLLARKTGADLCVEGHYRLTGPARDSLYFWSNITDLHSKTTIASLPVVVCHVSNDQVCLTQLINHVSGYFENKDKKLFKIPNKDASRAYVNAQKIWADETQKLQIRNYLLEAIRLDSTFLDAYFFLLDYLNNENLYDNENDSIQLIRRRFTDLNDRQENYLNYYTSDLAGRNRETFKYYFEEYQKRPGDLFINTTGMVIAMEYLNDPLLAISLYRDINPDSLDLQQCVYCRSRENMALQAFMDINDMQQAGKIVAHLAPYAQKKAQLSKIIHYYVLTNDTVAVNELIDRITSYGRNKNDLLYYLRLTAQHAFVSGKPALSRHYASRAVKLFSEDINWQVGKCYALLGELDQAEKYFQNSLAISPNDAWIHSQLGVIYARLGKHDKARQEMIQLNTLKRPYQYGEIEYFKGTIAANMGDVQAALRHLSNAIEEGVKFGMGQTFLHDPDLVILNREKGYLQLLAKNRSSTVTGK